MDAGKVDLVRLGALNLRENNGIDIDIKRFIKHPEYNDGLKKNDMALIELIKPVHFDKVRLRPACLQQAKFSGGSLVAVRKRGSMRV